MSQPGFEVIDGGLQTSVQDLGRPGHRALGISASGALDPVSLRLANGLVGNADGAAAFEFRTPGPVFRVVAPRMRLALAGTAAGLIVERAGNARHWASWRAIDVQAGDILRIPPFADTAIAYLALAGGVAVPEVLGSRSTLLPGGFGGYQGRALRAGDAVPVALDPGGTGPRLTLLQPPVPALTVRLRVIPGPQAGHFTPEALRILCEQEFTVTRDLDRMGIRLDGPALAHSGSSDIVSDGTVPGALQVPGSGHPILLLADCQSTGGYPKIATVISADLPAAGRLTAGTRVRFTTVDMEGAADARNAAADTLARSVHSMVAIRDPFIP